MRTDTGRLALHEIRGLRRELELARAKLEVVDIFARAIGVVPTHGMGATLDITWQLEKELEEQEREERAPPPLGGLTGSERTTERPALTILEALQEAEAALEIAVAEIAGLGGKDWPESSPRKGLAVVRATIAGLRGDWIAQEPIKQTNDITKP